MRFRVLPPPSSHHSSPPSCRFQPLNLEYNPRIPNPKRSFQLMVAFVFILFKLLRAREENRSAHISRSLLLRKSLPGEWQPFDRDASACTKSMTRVESPSPQTPNQSVLYPSPTPFVFQPPQTLHFAAFERSPPSSRSLRGDRSRQRAVSNRCEVRGRWLCEAVSSFRLSETTFICPPVCTHCIRLTTSHIRRRTMRSDVLHDSPANLSAQYEICNLVDRPLRPRM
jgi:hypothetical protein